jgi:hypothetical protein
MAAINTERVNKRSSFRSVKRMEEYSGGGGVLMSSADWEKVIKKATKWERYRAATCVGKRKKPNMPEPTNLAPGRW